MNHKLADRAAGKTDAADGAVSEPRTMQFVVERHCPLITPPFEWKPAAFEDALPVLVWVNLDIPTRLACGGVCYLVATWLPILNKDGIRGLLRTARPGLPAVCEHMGHLIE